MGSPTRCSPKPLPKAVDFRPAPAGNLPLSEAVSGSTAWVNPSSHMTLYFLTSDTATGSTCTVAAAGCLNVWPAFQPVAGSASDENMTILTRSGGTGHVARPQAAPAPPPGGTPIPCHTYC